jgi:predicted nucleic acid-binding protein
MPFVVDPSFAAAWFLPDEANDVASASARGLAIEPALAPGLFRYELRNLLFVAHLRNRIDMATLVEQLNLAVKFAIKFIDAEDASAIVALALKHKLTSYDATYLALALERRLDLASNDNDLLVAARKEGVKVITSLERG